jgi:replication-associated recombination protein RarA
MAKASNTIKFQVQGVDQLVKRLKAVEKISVQEVQKAIAPISVEMANKLKAASPTPAIANAIGIVHETSKYPQAMYIGVLNSHKHGAQLAYIFEYGTVDRNYKNKNNQQHRTGAIAPQFYFRNTVLSNQNQLATKLEKNISKLVENKLNK